MAFVALNLKRFRAASGLTQLDLATAAAVSYKHYQKIETGQWPDLQVSTMVKLSRVLQIAPRELLTPRTEWRRLIPRTAKRRARSTPAGRRPVR